MNTKPGLALGRILCSWLAATRRQVAEDRGASVVEYAMLVLFIAVVAIAAVAALGPPVSDGLVAGGDGFAP
jgi:Flp pilus assembly pilin Flp